MRTLVVLVLVLSGCQSLLGIDDFQTGAPNDGSTDPDAPADAFVIDTPPGSPCFGTLSPVCFATLPVADVALSGSINTDTDPRCEVRTQASGPDLCAITGNRLAIDPPGVTVTGSRPLVLVATDELTVFAPLSASSERAGPTGPGANVTACAGPSGTAGGNNGAGGGAGGSLGQRGGNGGAGAGLIGAPPGLSTAVVAVSSIRGGCAGGRGGAGENGASAPGGSSGGAVALLAGAKILISVSGGVFASGAGGSSNADAMNSKRAGGGGGGSGGLIVLEAPSIEMLGTCTANGGGGGGGARDGTANPGQDGATNNYNVRAAGGSGNNNGGNGGDGGVVGLTPGSGEAGQNQAAGGGGGAGAGVIWVKGTVSGTRFSPAPQLN